MPLLQVVNVSKAFPGVQALSRVKFDLRSGEVHALIGENGAGKSTLIKVLAGVHEKDEGEILINGERVEIRNPRDAMNLGISVIHQELNLVPYLSVAENVALGSEPVRTHWGLLDRNAMRKRAEDALRLIDADIDPNAIIANLSIAQRQMVEIARAISYDTRILIMDEPTSSLTEAEVEKLFRVVETLRSKGVGIIYVSHRLDEIFQICQRVTVFRDGQYVGTRAVSEVTKDDLVAMMVARRLSDYYKRDVVEMGNVVLEIRNLSSSSFLKNVSFNVRHGEVVGIAGLVGAGRTELARAIFGVDPYEGEIILEGRPVKIKSPQQALSLGIGYVPEDRKKSGLILKMAVQANLSMAYMNLRNSAIIRFGQFIDSRNELDVVKRFIKSLNIKTPSERQGIDKLSGGNQQKVILAKWLAIEPKVLILDEPTRGVDVGAKAEIYSLINGCTKRGMGIIMISSELPEILGMSDRIIVMGRGEVRGELSAGEATQEKIMRLAI